MDTSADSPQNLEERLIWYAITGTWGFYVLGALYLLAPLLGWFLVGLIFWRVYSATGKEKPADRARFPTVPIFWCLGMLGMLVALVVGHIGYGLPVGALIKSSIGWAKGWALLAVFMMVGASLNVRPRIVARAVNRLALQTLCLLPIFIAAGVLHLPNQLYVSPLKLVGGPGPEFFAVQLYSASFAQESARWAFFSPWAPAAGMVANMFLVVGLLDKSWGWKLIGIAAAVAMCVMSQSRLALIALLVVPFMAKAMSNLSHPRIFSVFAAGAALGGVMMQQIIELNQTLQQRFVEARAASSRVRAALGRIAVQRWQDEAPVFGHGVVEKGPHLVEFMPIGSHHTWYGLLYVKGMFGFMSLAVPMFSSTLELIAKAQTSRTARSALGILLLLFFYTFGENLEILVYQFWPGLLIMGRASRERLRNPFAQPFTSSPVVPIKPGHAPRAPRRGRPSSATSKPQVPPTP